MPKSRPILFSTDMVQAILENRKTQTRRIVKPQPSMLTDKSHFNFKNLNYLTKEQLLEHCPFGKTGDLLYVKEAHKVRQDAHYEGFVVTYQDGAEVYFNENELSEKTVKNLLNRKTLNTTRFVTGRYMPKEAARIYLRVKEVRVERLCDISELEAIIEGVESYTQAPVNSFSNAVTSYHVYPNKVKTQLGMVTAKQSFKSLWTSINGPESWQQNPWVWVVVYEVVSTTGKEAING